MTLLQPWVLAALPLIALPIIIHLINQRRYQTLQWGAMMFLLAANRMSRGYARIRQWLILAARTLAIFALIFTIGRPLASGWLGMAAGGRADTTIILLDRSPSMMQRDSVANRSKLEAGIQQLVTSLGLLRSSRWVLIDSQSPIPRELETPESLLEWPGSQGSSASADLPAMLEAARTYVDTNKAGRTEIWICSDLRANDWNRDSGRWAALRDSFLEFPQTVRFHLLAYPDTSPNNLAVRVLDARRDQTSSSNELVLTILLEREGNADEPITVPVAIEIEGARSEVSVEFAGPRYELKDHRIPLDGRQQRGWGMVSIPSDGNPADNQSWFVFDAPPARRTLVVADDPTVARVLQIAASIPPEPSLECTTEVLAPEQLAAVDWSTLALVLWHAPLPEGETAESLARFVGRGGHVMFFPPASDQRGSFQGASWTNWHEAKPREPVRSWRGDEDLLAHAQSGTALPVGELDVIRYRGLEGELTPLAVLDGGGPLLARAPTTRGGVYFCTTTPAPGDSSLAVQGITLYVMIQRALARGAEVLGNTQRLVAGQATEEEAAEWQALSTPPEVLSTDYATHGGVYAAGERLIAVNRAAAEDHAAVLTDAQVQALFKGLDFTRVDDRASNTAALVQEIWRMFLLAMMLALLLEAILCFPKVTRPITAGANV